LASFCAIGALRVPNPGASLAAKADLLWIDNVVRQCAGSAFVVLRNVIQAYLGKVERNAFFFYDALFVYCGFNTLLS
jgi:hypothetical protein